MRWLAFIGVFFSLACPSARAEFGSIHVFGDGLSCTASNNVTFPSSTNYYGKRFANGRVWVEVLAQMQGLPFDPLKNTNSFFGNTSSNLFAQTTNFTAALSASDASNALVIIWVNNADLYYPAYASPPTFTIFSNAITLALTNQFKSITNLYTKGVRTLIMPNVVDISSVPEFNNYIAQTNLFRQVSTNYNFRFTQMLNVVKAGRPDLKIIVPDFFGLLISILATPATYGLTNALYDQGNGPFSIDAIQFPQLSNKSPSGPGTNFIFWDSTNPSAKVHYLMASEAQQLISPVKISQIASANSISLIEIANVPVYTNTPQNGLVLSSTNLTLGNWRTNSAFSTTNVVQSVPVTNNTPQAFFRVQFPYVWNWP